MSNSEAAVRLFEDLVDRVVGIAGVGYGYHTETGQTDVLVVYTLTMSKPSGIPDKFEGIDVICVPKVKPKPA